MDSPWRIHAVNAAAIGKAIEEELGNRKGQRTDLRVSQAGVGGEFVLMPRLVFGTAPDNVAANDRI